MSLSADSERCIGAGQCVWALPGVFAQSERDGTVLVREPHPPGELHASVREAVRACPSGALRWSVTDDPPPG